MKAKHESWRHYQRRSLENKMALAAALKWHAAKMAVLKKFTAICLPA